MFVNFGLAPTPLHMYVLPPLPTSCLPRVSGSDQVRMEQGGQTTDATEVTEVTLLSSAQGCRFCRA